MLSEQEINCVKMCQKAPNCTDFSNFPGGEHAPRPPYLRLPPTMLAFIHFVHTNSQARCYYPEYRLEQFSLLKVCQIHNDSAEIILI